jgi:LCP family protein required for cell wall assembly
LPAAKGALKIPKNRKKTDYVSLASKTARQNPAGRAAKKGTGKSKKVVTGILSGIIVLMAIFIIAGGIMVYRALSSPGVKVEVIEEMTSYIKTPSNLQSKVAYYIVGLLGEEIDSTTETLAIVCWDKKAGTLNILQIPQDTYLGDSGRWAVRRAADVWGNPKDLDWCLTCRGPVEKDEIQNNKHTACNTVLSKEKGSASQDLCGVFNHLLGLPVDGYFLFPQQGLVKLVNLVGGIDVSLDSAITVGDISYKKGVQTIDGGAALYLSVNKKSGITGDIDRMVRQRKVFAALFQRLARLSKDRLGGDCIIPLMNGSTPIRTNFSRDEIVDLIFSMRDINLSSITAYVLPGRTGNAGGKTYYAAHKSSLLELINQAFNPHGIPINEDSFPELKELGSGKPQDTRKQALSEIAVEQSGLVTTTAATTTTKP